MSYGFYSLPQLAAVRARETARGNLLTAATAAIARVPAPVKAYALPGIYKVPWPVWWAAAGPFTMDADAAHQCALAFALAGGPQYAAKALAIINAWATVNQTIDPEEDAPLSAAELGLEFILADILLGSTAGGTPSPTLGAWVRNVYIPNADSIKTRPNNWGAWGTFAKITAAKHIGMDYSADVVLLVEQLATMIDPATGQLTQEMLRLGAQLWYSYYALVALTGACRVVRNGGGPDLFRATPAIPTALNALARMFANQVKETTGTQTPTAAAPWPMDLFAAMGEEYDNDAWRALAAPYAPIQYFGQHGGWNVPTLMCLAGG